MVMKRSRMLEVARIIANADGHKAVDGLIALYKKKRISHADLLYLIPQSAYALERLKQLDEEEGGS